MAIFNAVKITVLPIWGDPAGGTIFNALKIPDRAPPDPRGGEIHYEGPVEPALRRFGVRQFSRGGRMPPTK